MSTQPDHSYDPVPPQPTATPEALRAALAQVAPGSLAAFDAEIGRILDAAFAEAGVRRKGGVSDTLSRQYDPNGAYMHRPARRTA
ncbi:hypothetical protein [Streptomyces sp. RTd22]|uniref:hypothetical protein n=1 Tax=Streptomyces sp. RTd22 TaxID=1841249 RepID=UPI0007C5B010|nr:hypothetical protein [Streptomyces sp. RTd22]